MTEDEINHKVTAIKRLRHMIELAEFLQGYATETYGLNRAPEWEEKQKAIDKTFKEAQEAINSIADILESDLIFKKLFSDLGIDTQKQ